jgi:hypothetical protein
MRKRAPSGMLPRSGTVTVIALPGTKPGIRPLTAKTREGEPYKRFDDVERQIERLAQAQPHMWPTIVREGIDNHSVKNEAVVYLIREAWHRGNDKELLELHSDLFDRMATMILNRATRMGISDAAPLIEAVQNRIIELLYNDGESATADFLEVAFNRVVSCEILKWNRRHGKYWQRLDIDADITDQSVVEHSTILSATSIDQIEAGISAENIIKNARKWLASPHFEAFYLHYIKGIPVEATKKSKVCLVRHFRRPASTIYFWLDRAVAIIRANLSQRPEE